MSRAQRFTFLGIAVVIAVVAVILLADSSEDDSSPPASNAGATATATATPTTDQPEETSTPTPTPTPELPLLDGSKVVKLDFKQGETVRFRVVSDTPEEVHIHGYDIAKDLEPGKVTTVSFPATIEGGFEIEYEGQGKQIAELQVHPD